MKLVMKRLIRDQKGAALLLAVILLLVGGLIAAPLLAHMGTGMLTGEVYERRTNELYAADAGVEDAIWSIQNESIPPELWVACVDRPDWDVYQYPERLSVGEKSVEIAIYRKDWDETCGENLTYQILSTAVSADTGNTAAIDTTTAVDAYLSVSYMDFSSLLDYAIVSQDEIGIQPNNYVDGDVWLPHADDLDGEEYIDPDHTIYDSTSVNVTWPGAEDLSAYYLDDVEGAPDPGPSVDIEFRKTLGPCDRKGSLTIDNGGDPDTLVLEDTVYVRGDLTFEQPGASKHYTIDLNGQTIFAEGSVTLASGHISISGSGCIIAVGDIVFQPNMSTEPTDFVLILSIGVGSTVTVQPNGSFTGCVAGDDVVTLQPGHPNDEFTLRWIDPEGKDLNFPMGVSDDPNQLPPVTAVRIDSWEVIQE